MYLNTYEIYSIMIFIDLMIYVTFIIKKIIK